jgi:predicted enzyme related to lactoylglutathione lyase
MSNRVSHFEIHADDLERATAFYREVFGWDIQKWPMPDGTDYLMAMTGSREEAGGINGGFIKRPCAAPTLGQGLNGYCCTLTVDDYDGVAEKILAHGGKEAMPKFALAGMAWQGYFIDSEGNTFGIHQPDVNAK